MKLTVLDTVTRTSKKTGKPYRMVSLMYTRDGFIEAGTYFVPVNFNGELVPDTEINGCISDGKLIEIYE